jgi:hypothetical protein
MKKILCLFIFATALYGCKSKSSLSILNKNNTSVSIDTLFTDKISIRAIEIDQNKVWYAGDKNRFGYFDLITNQRVERKINSDSLQIEFRSIAQTSHSVFILSVGNPALLYKINKKSQNSNTIWLEKDRKFV